MKGIQVCSNKEPRLFPRGDNYEIVKTHGRNKKNHTSNFNQTWHKVFLGEGDSSFVKWRMPVFKETSKWDSENTLTKFKNLLLQNHPATFNQSFWKLPSVKDPQGFTNKDHSMLKMRYQLIQNFSYSSTLCYNHSIAQMCLIINWLLELALKKYFWRRRFQFCQCIFFPLGEGRDPSI